MPTKAVICLVSGRQSEQSVYIKLMRQV